MTTPLRKTIRAESTAHDESPTSLDPADWDAFRRSAHRMLDDTIDHIANIRENPVWRAMPEETRARFSQPLPSQARNLDDVLDDVRAHIVPYATGNLHPSFMGWVHGAGTPVGMVAELIAAGLNMNCGGRDHVGIEIEKQIVRWMSQALNYPSSSSGLFVTGSSMANFLAVTIAKNEALGSAVRQRGLKTVERQLTAYTSCQAHICIAQAMELSGLGSENLRSIAVDADGRLQPDALSDAIKQDRASGMLPFLVVGTAGTVNTGAVDPLAGIAIIAKRERLWFHVDGAIGALGVLAPSMRQLFSGIESSASVALDFHKWGHVPYDAGFLLVADGAAHKRAFAQPAAYLQRTDRGLSAGDTWPCDLGPDLSRGFRALKTWMTIETLGSERMGEAIARTCDLARYLAERLQDDPRFEIKAPVMLNIVCFTVRGADAAFTRNLVLDLHESGLAAPSSTTINGELAVRCAIVNHRTSRADIDLFMDALNRYLA